MVTCASTSSTSMPEKATVRTRATKLLLLARGEELYGNIAGFASLQGRTPRGAG
jgi:hypothetical protein